MRKKTVLAVVGILVVMGLIVAVRLVDFGNIVEIMKRMHGG